MIEESTSTVPTTAKLVRLDGTASSSRSTVHDALVSPASSTKPISPMISKPERPKYRYSVKIINPSKKRDYSVLPLRVNEDFVTTQQLKDELLESFPNHASGQHFEFGYIGPGHGARGKQRWITTDYDLEDM